MFNSQANGSYDKTPERPRLLTFLCVLTFIGSGMACFSYLMSTLFYSEVKVLILEQSKELPVFGLLSTASLNFFLTGFILYFLSLAGAILMWRFKIIGFHLYIAAQLMLLILPLVYIKDYPLPIFDALLTGIFILFYSMHYKLLKGNYHG